MLGYFVQVLHNGGINVKRNLLFFADDSFGNNFAINLNPEQNYGYIYFIDNELDEKIIINHDFETFMLSLYSKEQHLEKIKLEDPEFYARLQALKSNPQIR